MNRVRAAGGLMWRPDSTGAAEICLVHREHYQDWTLPKGKLKQDEHPLEGAVREVLEETGVRARPQLPLSRTRYQVGGAPKSVDYWAMSGDHVTLFRPSSEVDSVAWLPVPAAVHRLTYPADVRLVRRWQRLPTVTATVLLVRHAFAGTRAGWSGPDDERPLTPDGRQDAARLCDLLGLFAPQALATATPHRCQQTLAPLVAATGLPATVMTGLDESADDPEAAAACLRDLAAAGACAVACSQGKVIGPALARLTGDPRFVRRTTPKGDGWLVPFAGTTPLAPTRLAVGPSTPARRPDRR